MLNLPGWTSPQGCAKFDPRLLAILRVDFCSPAMTSSPTDSLFQFSQTIFLLLFAPCFCQPSMLLTRSWRKWRACRCPSFAATLMTWAEQASRGSMLSSDENDQPALSRQQGESLRHWSGLCSCYFFYLLPFDFDRICKFPAILNSSVS